MLGQINIYGNDKVETAIKRFQTFEPPEGYYLAFSGGKDSVVIKALADMSGVKYDAHYTVTSVDPPELVQFIKEYYPDVSRDRPLDKDGKQITMWNLIPSKTMPPTRIVRYCCQYLKEYQGEGRFVVTGVRKAESAKRSHRGGIEMSDTKSGRHEMFDVDNAEDKMIRTCMNKSKRILNPIIDWSTEDVWEFIREYNVPYCKLYDEGFRRLGCVGCPMASYKDKKMELERWPKFKQAYIRALKRMAINVDEKGRAYNKDSTGEEILNWWIGEGVRNLNAESEVDQ